MLPSLDLNMLLQLHSHLFLVLTDDERARDFDVIFGFRAMQAILTGDVADLHRIFPRISNRELFADFFSLLFLTDLQDEFVCTFETVETVVELLSDFWTEQVDVLAAAKSHVKI
jgi:hypothetical protein